MACTTSLGEALHELGLAGRPVCLHSSFRAVRVLAPTPESAIDSFLAAGCTLLAPTFSYRFQTPPPPNTQPPQNGHDYSAPAAAGQIDEIYSPSSRAISGAAMGAIPTALARHPKRVRGNHPLNSFSAVGPRASHYIEAQTPLDVYAPLYAMAHDGGFVLLAGVDLTRLTLLHAAEELAGRRLFIRWTRNASGEVQAVRVGGCGRGFNSLAPTLRAIRRHTIIGDWTWQAYPAQEVLSLASQAIADTPEITRCTHPDCLRCRDALLGGPPEPLPL